MLKIDVFKVGRLKTNCYLIYDEYLGDGVILDPGGNITDFENTVLAKCNLKYILITHGHFDHILNAGKYKKLSGAKIIFPHDDKEFIFDNHLNLSDRFLRRGAFEAFNPDIFVSEGDEIEFCGRKIKVLATPGHTKGGVSYILEDKIFSGDTLFCGAFGSTAFPTGDESELRNSLKKIANLSAGYIVYPGHSKATLLSIERKRIENF